MSEKQKKMKTRCYYTEYVNHMVRFFLTCPDSLKMDKVRKRADVDNWLSVQSVLHSLSEDDREKVLTIYRTHYNLPYAVTQYCEKTGANEKQVWTLLTRTASQIAKYRELI